MITILHQRSTVDPFSRVPKALLDDERISWKAKGLLAYLLGKPQGWKVQVEDICKRGPEREDGVRAGLQELRDCNYVRVERQTCNGRIAGWLWVVSDTPNLAPEQDLPVPATPYLETPDLVNPDLSKKELSKKEGKQERIGTSKPDSSNPESVIFGCYPKHASKKKGLEAIRKALAKTDFETLLAKTQKYATCRAAADPQFTPHAATWFNQERYDDDPATWISAPQPKTAGTDWAKIDREAEADRQDPRKRSYGRHDEE